ncbi:MAG: ATP-binding protein [Christensenellaceae bacterium]|jgi:predicted AAA+ superfamily ATPase|nr:ATP-binding protein [Christensenellaceae bacterium]
MEIKYIPRLAEKIIERQKTRKPVLMVTGPRQVGKTTMLKHILRDGTYIRLDSPMVRATIEQAPNTFLREQKRPCIIDEIQKSPILFEYIKDIVDDDDATGQFYLTGSQSFRFMKGVTESLAGRVGVINVLGLSLREINGVPYNGVFKPTKEHIDAMANAKIDKILPIIHRGSFPELYKTESDNNDWQDFYASYVQTYIERDVRDLVEIHNLSAFTKFIKVCASITGGQLNYSTLAEYSGVDVTTAKRWISILETSGLIYLLQPYSNNLCKRLVKTPKLYFTDTGLACFLSGWNTPEQLYNGAMWGHIFETYVIGEIVKSYYNNGNIYPPLYYYRDANKNEIDLIIEDGETLHPVEIKAGDEPTKDAIKSFRLLENTAKKIGDGAVVCLSKYVLPLTENVRIIPVWFI